MQAQELRPAEFIFVIATLLSLAAYSLWPYFDQYEAFYGKCMSLAMLGWIYSVHRLTARARWQFNCITWVVTWWSVGNAMDELFFDPYSNGVLELSFALLTAAAGCMRYRKTKKPLWVRRLLSWLRL